MSWNKLAALALVLFSFGAQAQTATSISNLPPAQTPLTGTELVPLDQMQNGKWVTGSAPASALMWNNHCISIFEGMSSAAIIDALAGTMIYDDTAALQAFLSGVQTGGNYCLEPGQFKFTSPLTVNPNAQHYSLRGTGMYSTQLVYQGAATTSNLFTAGNTNIFPNLFANPTAPATQTIPVTSGHTYILIFYGTGTITPSGAYSSSAISSYAYLSGPTSVTFMAASTSSLTLTLSGSITLPYLFDYTANTVNTEGADIGGFMVRSINYNTGGANYYLANFSTSRIHDVSCGGANSYNQTSYNCFFFDGAHQVDLRNFEAVSQHDGVQFRGGWVSSNADLWITHGFANFNGDAGIHSLGGFGGGFIDHVETLGNHQYNLLIDDQAEGASNFACSGYSSGCPYSTGQREYILGPNYVSDGVLSTPVGIMLNDPHNQGGSLTVNSYIGSATTTDILINAWSGVGVGVVNIHGGRIFNTTTSAGCTGGNGFGIWKADPAAVLNVARGAELDNNNCGAVGGASADTGGGTVEPFLASNNGTGINANVGNFLSHSITTVSSTGGSGVAGSGTVYYKFIGKMVCMEGSFTLSSLGSGSGFITAVLPFTAARQMNMSAGTASSHLALWAQISGSTLYVAKYDGTYLANSSDPYQFSGCIDVLLN